MVDPITANGVTAALRHAAEASGLILKYRKRGTLPLLGQDFLQQPRNADGKVF